MHYDDLAYVLYNLIYDIVVVIVVVDHPSKSQGVNMQNHLVVRL